MQSGEQNPETRRRGMADEDRTRDDTADEPAPVEAPAVDADDDEDVVDAHVWRAQT
jgi:hypothetical protein